MTAHCFAASVAATECRPPRSRIARHGRPVRRVPPPESRGACPATVCGSARRNRSPPPAPGWSSFSRPGDGVARPCPATTHAASSPRGAPSPACGTAAASDPPGRPRHPSQLTPARGSPSLAAGPGEKVFRCPSSGVGFATAKTSGPPGASTAPTSSHPDCPPASITRPPRPHPARSIRTATASTSSPALPPRPAPPRSTMPTASTRRPRPARRLDQLAAPAASHRPGLPASTRATTSKASTTLPRDPAATPPPGEGGEAAPPMGAPHVGGRLTRQRGFLTTGGTKISRVHLRTTVQSLGVISVPSAIPPMHPAHPLPCTTAVSAA